VQPCGDPEDELVPEKKSMTKRPLRARHVLPLEEFDIAWHTKPYDMIPGKLKYHRRSAIELVVGVFSGAGSEARPYRDVIRDTWLRQPYVCSLSEGRSDACSVYVTFVVGNDRDQDPAEADVTILPIKENMDEGKTRVWFQFAATQWPWGTHIMKMDLDAFPYFSNVLRMIGGSSHFSCRNVYGGNMMSWSGAPFMPSRPCGLPLRNNFMKYEHDDPDCFAYAQGAMYLLTRELAANASKAGEYWDLETREHCYPEDVMTARALKHYGKDHDVCISALDLQWGEARWHVAGNATKWTGCPK